MSDDYTEFFRHENLRGLGYDEISSSEADAIVRAFNEVLTIRVGRRAAGFFRAKQLDAFDSQDEGQAWLMIRDAVPNTSAIVREEYILLINLLVAVQEELRDRS